MNLFVLPFDHRSSFIHDLYGFTPPLSAEQTDQIAQAKALIYQGFMQADLPPAEAGVLVDEQFGAAILADARQRGYVTACPVEKSGQATFDFEYTDWQAHIERVDPSYVKVLVRYNPQGDAAANVEQRSRLADLSAFVRGSGRRLMFELLVPATDAQQARPDHDPATYDTAQRPALMVQAMRELQGAGIEPQLWKVEGVDRPADAQALVQAARREGRDAHLIVLGRDADDAQVERWLRVAAATPGFVGFAVGRTTFEAALRHWKAGDLGAEQAAAEIARLYRHWAEVYQSARARA